MLRLRFLFILPLALGLALTGCVEDPPDPAGGAFSAAACLAGGGTPGRGGLLGQAVCFQPHADAGTMCRRATDCQGMCLAGEDGGTCSAQSPMFGCVDFLDDTGQRLGICID